MIDELKVTAPLPDAPDVEHPQYEAGFKAGLRFHDEHFAPQPDARPFGDDVEYEFAVWQDDAYQAGGTAPTLAEAQVEAEHYAMMYGQDGRPVEVRYFERRELTVYATVAEGTR